MVKSGRVITSSPLCTSIGQRILNTTDNPVDASVAALLCLSVVAPHQCSLAAGAFVLMRNNGVDKFLDLQFGAPNNTHNGAPVAVPRFLTGLKTAMKDYGSIPFSQVAQPSIDLATKGFPLTNEMSFLVDSKSEVWKKYFPVAGNTVKSPVLANTLKIAAAGERGFSLGEDISRATNGTVSSEDYSSYQKTVKWEDAVSIDVAGWFEIFVS